MKLSKCFNGTKTSKDPGKFDFLCHDHVMMFGSGVKAYSAFSVNN